MVRLNENDICGQGLAGRVIRFAAFLKDRGYRVFQNNIHSALLSLKAVGIFEKEDFRTVVRTNFASNDLEWTQFGDLFEEFWRQEGEESQLPEKEDSLAEQQDQDAPSEMETLPDAEGVQLSRGEATGEPECQEGFAYSPLSRVERKDVACFDKADIQLAQLTLKKILAPFRIQTSRRYKRSRKHADLDFPRTMRRSLKGEGLPIELFYRQRKKRLKRLVILADVSGSMDRYARFVMPFLLGLRGVGSKAEVFVFSTSLTRISPMIRHMNIEKVLERIPYEVPDWSGGTRIGHSLHQFNQSQGEKLLTRRTVVIILSDGWDLGGKLLLSREMETLSKKAYAVMWLNPLAGDPDYRPVCQGMSIARPYVDYFLPANSLESLKRVGRLLSHVMVH